MRVDTERNKAEGYRECWREKVILICIGGLEQKGL